MIRSKLQTARAWVLLVAMTTWLMPAAVIAQSNDSADADDSSDIDSLEEIVVYGSRRINRDFVDVKRNSIDIVDSLGEDDIATLPAINSAEVVKRLPGVAVFNDGFGSEAGERGGGVVQPTTLEARFASVRGIRGDLNLTQLDGMNLAIPNQAGRTNFLDWFPVNLAKRVEVRKTFDAEQDGNAIGGIVNIVTRSGFDYEEPLINAGLSINHDTLNDGPQSYDRPYNAQIVYAAPLNDKFAITATANYNHRDFFFPHRNNEARRYFDDTGVGVSIGFNHPIGETLGNGIPVPIANRLNSSSVETDRYGGAFKLDFRPSDSTDISLTGAISVLNQEVFGTENDIRQPLFCFAFFGCNLAATEQIGGATGTGVIEIAAAESIFSDSLLSANDSKLRTVMAALEHRFNDDWTLEGKLATSRATQEQFDLGFFYSVPLADLSDPDPATPGNPNGLTWRYDFSDPANPIINVDDPGRIFDPTTYDLQRANQLGLDLQEDNLDLKLNIAYNVDTDDFGFGFKAGLRYKDVDRDFSEFRTQYNTSVAGMAAFTLDQVLSSSSGQGLDIPNRGNLQTLLQDTDAANSLITPQLGDASLFTRVPLSDAINDYTITEETEAAFVYVRYATDRSHVNVGLRYENTEHRANGVVLDQLNGTITDGTQTGGVDNLFRPEANGGKQDFLLPSFTFVYDIRDDVKLRVGYSQSLGRPGYNSLAPQGDTFTTSIDTTSPATIAATITNATGSRTIANPDLKPRQSDNYDLALEWYIDGGEGVVSLGYFRKDIEDEIFTASAEETIMIDVPTVPMQIPLLVTTTTVQNASRATIDGFEFNLVKNLSFIPYRFFENVGINLNATFIDGDFDDLNRVPIGGGSLSTPGVLPGQPEELANFTVFYSTELLDLNVGLNYTGDMNTFFNSAEAFGAGQDVYNEARTTLNTKASYRLRENIQLYFEANNLTEEELVRYSGDPSLNSIRRRFVTGRTFAFGANITF